MVNIPSDLEGLTRHEGGPGKALGLRDPPYLSLRDPVDIPLRRIDSLSAPGELQIWWLGQAGFLLQWEQFRILVDPYLSDALSKKYAGKRFPHIRMVPPPVLAEDLRDVDAVFSTHGHSDHMDPEALQGIAANNPDCNFIIPLATRGTALERGIPENRMLPMDAGQTLSLPGCRVEALPSAHETLQYDQAGHCIFLGYVLDTGFLRLYHSGDCVPYAGLEEVLTERKIDVALLPVNGRDEERSSMGILGNFTLEEAVDLVLGTEIGLGIGHHFGMFDFNTLDTKLADAYLAKRPDAFGRFILAQPSTLFNLTRPYVNNRIDL